MTVHPTTIQQSGQHAKHCSPPSPDASHNNASPQLKQPPFFVTGPKVTQLFHANIDEFTLDELVNLLPALELIIHVGPAPEQNGRCSG